MELDTRGFQQGRKPCLPQGLMSGCPLAVPSALMFLAAISGRRIFWSVSSMFQGPHPHLLCSVLAAPRAVLSTPRLSD